MRTLVIAEAPTVIRDEWYRPYESGSNSQVNTRILHPGSKAQYKPDTRNYVSQDARVYVVFWCPNEVAQSFFPLAGRSVVPSPALICGSKAYKART